MNRSDFQRVASIRAEEARVLLYAGLYSGAYYLMGYAIECGLKACVAKQVKRYDFPDKKLANEAFVHDLEKLMRVYSARFRTGLFISRGVAENAEKTWMISAYSATPRESKNYPFTV